MAVFRITSPEGTTYEVTAPENATEQEVMDYVYNQIQAGTAPPPLAGPRESIFKPAEEPDPLTRGERFTAGLARGFEGATTGIEQAALAGAEQLGIPLDRIAERREELTQREAQQQRIFEEQIGDEGYALAGRFVGEAAPFIALPAAGKGALARIAGGALSAALGAGTRAEIENLPPGKELTKRLTRATFAAPFGAAGAGVIMGGQKLIGAAANKIGNLFGRATQNVDDILEDVVERGIEDTQAFEGVRNILGDEAERLAARIHGKGGRIGLFDYAKARGSGATVNKKVIAELKQDLTEQIADEIDDDAITVLSNVRARLDQLPDEPTVNDLQAIRRAATKLSFRDQGSKGYAGGQIKRQIDDKLIDASENNLIKGDDEAVKLWREAINARRDFGDKFETPKEIALSLTDEPLEVIEAKFLGTGAINKRASKIYDETLKAIPKDQQKQAGFLLRQSVFNKMIKRAAARADDPDGIDSIFLANQIKNLRRDNKSLWNKFPESEKKLLNTLENNLRSETKNGVINNVAKSMFRFLSMATRSNLQLPSIVRPKKIVTIEDIIDLANAKPMGTEIPFENIITLGAGQRTAEFLEE